MNKGAQLALLGAATWLVYRATKDPGVDPIVSFPVSPTAGAAVGGAKGRFRENPRARVYRERKRPPPRKGAHVPRISPPPSYSGSGDPLPDWLVANQVGCRPPRPFGIVGTPRPGMARHGGRVVAARAPGLGSSHGVSCCVR